MQQFSVLFDKFFFICYYICVKNNYYVSRDLRNTQKTANFLQDLPEFCFDYFLELENYTSSLTRMNYAVDLRIFFDFICRFKFGNKPNQITFEHIEKITSSDITSFLSYLSYYTFNGKNYRNKELGKARKLASIRKLFKWLFTKDKIKFDVASKVQTPKRHEKPIIRLEVDEVSKLLNEVENADNLTKSEQKFNKLTQKRDLAMISLFLSTGIRVSECVGLNIDDFDFEQNAFRVTRKGGNQAVLYFPEETRDALLAWLYEREEKPLDEDEKAMFISLQNRRISVRAVENLVKKYAKAVTPLKNISPHKLRSTFGTNLYRETADIYIVADVLGHSDVNITKRHYAAISEDRRKDVANIVKLRKN